MRHLAGILGTILGRVLGNKVIPALRGLEPGRYPHPQWGPIVIPPTPTLEPGEPTPRRLPFQVTLPGVVGGLAVAYWLYKRRQRRAAELEGQQKELFPGLRRELQLKAEDVATSADPVEACLERVYGWNLDRVRELKQSIDLKTTPDMFTKKEEPLTGPESQLLDHIEDCLSRIEKEYGSLEAAGLNLAPCSAIDPLCRDEEDHDGGGGDETSINLPQS